MPEPTNKNDDSLEPMVWYVVVAHQRQRPDLYSGVPLSTRICEMGSVIGKMIACEAVGSHRPQNETAKRAIELAAIAAGQVMHEVLRHLDQLRAGAAPPDYSDYYRGGKPS